MSFIKIEYFCEYSLMFIFFLDIFDGRRFVDLVYIGWILCFGRNGYRKKGILRFFMK